MIVVRPLITEKSLLLASKGWYTFRVKNDARKENVVSEITTYYHVNPVRIRMISMHGKMRRVSKLKGMIRKPDWKKALVRLSKGQTIDAFEVTQEAKK